MKNSTNYQLVVPNNEAYLTTESKDSIQSAVAIAIKNGSKIDIEQDHSIRVNPSIGMKVGPDGFSLNIGCTINRNKINTYVMKD